MKIPFACAFKAFLASDDNTNHASYLLIFSQQDIKHVGVCGSSANFPQKTFPEKITQNKVCICQRGSRDQLCMFESEFFLTILGGTELMDPENSIYSYFNGRPKLSFQGEKGINVIVYPPTDN